MECVTCFDAVLNILSLTSLWKCSCLGLQNLVLLSSLLADTGGWNSFGKISDSTGDKLVKNTGENCLDVSSVSKRDRCFVLFALKLSWMTWSLLLDLKPAKNLFPEKKMQVNTSASKMGKVLGDSSTQNLTLFDPFAEKEYFCQQTQDGISACKRERCFVLKSPWITHTISCELLGKNFIAGKISGKNVCFKKRA